MNFGAREANDPEYAYRDMKDDMSDDIDQSVWDSVVRQTREARQWADERGNAGDNIPHVSLEGLEKAAENQDPETAIKAAHAIVSTQMHPTARDICAAPAKHLIYNGCGQRAVEYKKDN